jgi:mono/diheme cytochrome c family protein
MKPKALRVLLPLCLALGSVWAQVNPVAVYQQNCIFCHGENGLGRKGAFPPLVEHAPNLVKTPEGRAFLINVVLYGQQGPIQAKGQRYNGVMASFAQLSDDQLAAVLNYALTNWGNERLLSANHKVISPTEVAAQRNNRLSPQQVNQQRSKLTVP